MRKTYLQIGAARLLDIRVIADNKIIYEGAVDTAPQEIKSLKYYDVNVNSDKVVYTIVIENTGNVDLTNVLVTDKMLEINKTIEKLEVGKKETISKEYTVTKEDIEAEQGIT